MDTLLQDIRFAIRSLLRQAGFALTAIVTLALGIGASTAIFSVVNAVLLRPLPLDGAARVVAVLNLWTRSGRTSTTVSAPDLHDWQAQNRSFERIAYYWIGDSSATVNGSATYVNAFVVSPGFFETLHARARAGRLLSADEQKPGGPLAAVISTAFWKRQFDGDPRAIGASVKFADSMFTIAGVLDPEVRFPPGADIYVPSWIWPETTSRSAHNYRAIARLRDGVTIEQARADMTAIAKRLEAEYPNSNAGKLTAVQPLQETIVGGTRDALYVLLGAVGLVLLIACANVANLLLSRSSVRAREMVVRAAVGAGRGRLVRQLLTESAVLGVISGLSGAWLARLAMLALVRYAPPDLPRLDEISVDVTALAFAVGIALASSVIFGLAPALHASRVQLADGLRQGGKGSSVGARAGWARGAFVVSEIAFAVVLVVAAGLLARSLTRLADVDMGFAPDRLLLLDMEVPVRSVDDAPRATALYRDVLESARALPGVTAAAATKAPPTRPSSNGGYWIEGGPGPDQTGVRAPQALFNVITPGYFRTLQVPVRRGRDFGDGDRAGAPRVAIVNESLARASFPNEDPIGRRIQCGLDSLDFMTIVGVVADIRSSSPAQSPQPEIYMPYEQHAGYATQMSILVRTGAPDPMALSDTIRRDIARRNPDVPVKASTMEMTLEAASATPRFNTFLLVVFAGVALVLALAGVYGVMAYTVSQRVPELGVRIALGATPESILKLILGQGTRLAAAGVAIGTLLALLSGRLLQGLLFGVTPRDPLILGAVVAVVGVATLAACYLPARRAVRVDPVVALRAE